MIHRIDSDLPSFKSIDFHPGLNVLLADREETSTDQQTRNRAGKSSLLEIVHFVLGANAERDSVFRRDELKAWSFALDFDSAEQRIVAERSGETFGRVIIRYGNTSQWPVQPECDNSLGSRDWCSVLGEGLFGLPANSGHEMEKYHPTFRSLFSYFVRRESAGAFRRPESQSTKQRPWDQQVVLAYLIGLDWRIPQAWQQMRDRKKALEVLKKAAAAGALGSVISTSAELRTQLVIAEQASQRLQESLGRFEVLPEYRGLEKDASQLAQQVNELANQNLLDEQLLLQMREALESEKAPETITLSRLYEEAGVVLPGSVTRRFEDVERFHNSVISNRRDYLASEVDAAENRLQTRRYRMGQFDARRGEIMRILESRGALEQFQELQQEAARQDAETEAIRQRFQAAQQLEGVRTELDIERARLRQQLNRDLDEQQERVSEAITTFESISRALYEDAGSLTLAPTDNGLKPEVHIQGQKSRGIQNMQIFCFDMMLMKLCARRRTGPGFLAHDSHLFDGVDERQTARALQLGAETAADCGWQYLVTLNSDAIPSEFPRDFDFNEHVLPVRLTDATEGGGLFGFRF